MVTYNKTAKLKTTQVLLSQAQLQLRTHSCDLNYSMCSNCHIYSQTLKQDKTAKLKTTQVLLSQAQLQLRKHICNLKVLQQLPYYTQSDPQT